MLFKLIVKVAVVGNTADTPNPPWVASLLKEIWESPRVAAQGDLVYRQYCLLVYTTQVNSTFLVH